MEDSRGKIVSVNISKETGTVKKPVEFININQRGVEEDAHSGAWHRQVSLLSQESIEKFSNSEGINRKISPGEFAENITTTGIDLSNCCLLDRFKINNAELEVTQIGKVCHGDTCAIFREVGNCVMPKEGLFCRVINGGRVEANDTLEYTPKYLTISVITVSDRASSGEYEDKSGPAIEEQLNSFFAKSHWRIKVIKKIVPDSAETLKKTIKDATETSDIIFTTGGTGIGSKDITPEVIYPMMHKELPGIMEFIRVKYGYKIPNALISRSVAGTIDESLIYALPGSVKAIKDYMEEILKTIEHSIFMIKDINTH